MLALTVDATLDLSASDARHGWGLFETVRVQQGKARWLEWHLERMAAGCSVLRLDLPPDAFAVRAFLDRSTPVAEMARGALRLVAVDDRLVVELLPAPAPDAGALTLGIAQRVRRFSGAPLNAFKTLSYAENRLLQQEAVDRGLSEVIALNERGELTDGGRTTLVLWMEGQAWTPAVHSGVLPGIARRALLEAGLVRERVLGVEALEQAEGVLLVNALRGGRLVRLDREGRLQELVTALA